MSIIGKAIRRARRAKESGRGWSQGHLAEVAQGLPGAPPITELQVAALERGRATVRLEDEGEPLPWILKALGVPGSVVLRAMGMGDGRAA